jgi:hypothetical protein
MDMTDPVLTELDLRLDQEWQESLRSPDTWNRRSISRLGVGVGNPRKKATHEGLDHALDNVQINDIANVVAASPLAVDARATRVTIQKVVQSWPISFVRPSDRRVDDVQFPNVVRLYLNTFVAVAFPSSPDKFIQTLVQQVSEAHPDLSVSDIRNRSLRFLCSLVRQHHFSCLLQESFDLVIWSERLDRLYGVDLLIIQDARAIGIRMGTSGESAERWTPIKTRRQVSQFKNLPTVTIEARRSSFVPGKLWLHQGDDVDRVRDFLAQCTSAEDPLESLPF